MHDKLAIINNRKIKADSSIEPKTKLGFYKDKSNRFEPHSSTTKDDTLREVFYKYCNFEYGYDVQPKIWKISGKLSQSFEELEKLMADNMEKLRNEDTEKLKADIISKIFFPCMRSSRPVKSVRETVEMYRSTKVMKKIEEYLARSQNILPFKAREVLESTIKNSPHFKNKIN